MQDTWHSDKVTSLLVLVISSVVIKLYFSTTTRLDKGTYKDMIKTFRPLSERCRTGACDQARPDSYRMTSWLSQ